MCKWRIPLLGIHVHVVGVVGVTVEQELTPRATCACEREDEHELGREKRQDHDMYMCMRPPAYQTVLVLACA